MLKRFKMSLADELTLPAGKKVDGSSQTKQKKKMEIQILKMQQASTQIGSL
jgi:hypothetical protein